MLLGIWQDIANIVTGFFAIIPQTLYFLFASAASLVDLLQYAMRKLVGLDVYYVDGVAQQGDILTEFIEGVVGINNSYSTLSTVFWSMVVFGVVLLVFATIIAIIKTHYNYDSEKSNPMYIIGRAIKGLLTMVIIPIATIFSLYLSQALLQTLDKITTSSNETTLSRIYENAAMDKFESKTINNQRVYSGFDFFKSHHYSNSNAFSSSIFVAAAYNANRVRNGNYSVSTGEDSRGFSNAGIFWTEDATQTKETIAIQIDTAFEYGLSLKNGETLYLKGDAISLVTSYNGLSSLYLIDLANVRHFSKFDTGLVFYYYNLWTFDFFIGFAGIFTAVTLLFNIILGLCSRLVYLVALFLVYPPITALFPFDDGGGVKSWRTSFAKMFLSSFSAVIGINLMTIILPFIRSISFFKFALLDAVMNALFVLAALMVVKKIIAMFSKYIGAESIEEVGGKMSKEFKQVATKAIGDVLKLANVGIAAGKSLALSTKNSMVRASNAKTKKGKVAAFLSPFGKKVTKEDREVYDKNKQKQYDDKHGVDELAEKKLQEDANDEVSKKRHNTDYGKRARARLEQERPDLFEAGKKEGTTKIKDGMRGEYNKLMAGKKKEIAKEDARAEVSSNSFGSKVANVVKAPFFQKQSEKKWGEEPESRKPRKWVSETGGLLKQAVSLGGQMVKLVGGDLMGISGMKKALDEAGVSEEFLGTMKYAGSSMGIDVNIKTKQDKDNDEKKAVESDQKSVKNTASIVQETTTSSIQQLTNEFQAYYKRRMDRMTQQKEDAKAKKTRKPSGSPGGNGDKKGSDDLGLTAKPEKAKRPVQTEEEKLADTKKFEEKKAKSKRSYLRRKEKEKAEAERLDKVKKATETYKQLDEDKRLREKKRLNEEGIAGVEKRVRDAEKALADAKDSEVQAQTKVRELEEQNNQMRRELRDAEEKLAETKLKVKQKEDEVDELRRKAVSGTASREELEKAKQELEELQEESRQAGIAWQEADEKSSKIRRDVSNAEEALMQAKKTSEDAEYETRRANDELAETKKVLETADSNTDDKDGDSDDDDDDNK